MTPFLEHASSPKWQRRKTDGLGVGEKPALRSSVLGSEAVKIPNDVLRNAGLPGWDRGRGLSFLGSNQGQFACVEPVASAVRALVHFNSTLGAEEMPMQLYPRATGTFPLA